MAAAFNGSAAETKLMWALDHEPSRLGSTKCEFRNGSFGWKAAIRLMLPDREALAPRGQR